LRGRQIQEHATKAGGYRLVQHQSALLVGDPASTLNEFNHFVRKLEVQLQRQGSLQIRFRELAMPTFAVLKVHVDTMAIILLGHGRSIGEE
jgi:hypothetical protein